MSNKQSMPPTTGTGHYQTPVIQHCHMESVTSLAWMEDDSRITIVSSTQIPHIVRRVVGQALNIPLVMRTSHQTVCRWRFW